MIPLALTLAVALGPAAPADGTYHYTLSVAGQAIGKTAIVVKRGATGMTVAETGDANFNGQALSGTAALTLDGALTPSAYSGAYTAMGRTTHASVAFTANTATETSDNGSVSFSLTSDSKRFVVLDASMFAGFFVLPAQMAAWNDIPVYAIAPMYGRGAPFAVDSTLKPDRPKTVPAADADLSVSSPVAFTIWYDPKTLVVDEMDVPAQTATFVRAR